MNSIALSRRAETSSLLFVQNALKESFATAACAPCSASICWALMTTCCATWAWSA